MSWGHSSLMYLHKTYFLLFIDRLNMGNNAGCTPPFFPNIASHRGGYTGPIFEAAAASLFSHPHSFTGISSSSPLLSSSCLCINPSSCSLLSLSSSVSIRCLSISWSSCLRMLYNVAARLSNGAAMSTSVNHPQSTPWGGRTRMSMVAAGAAEGKTRCLTWDVTVVPCSPGIPRSWPPPSAQKFENLELNLHASLKLALNS